MVTIRLTNSATRTKEDFVPIDPDNVRMYVCGPTVYDRAHLGNGRSAVAFDVLARLLRHVHGPEHVTVVRNITDVDDKINAAAKARKADGAAGTLEELIAERSDETTRWYREDMAALGVAAPDHEPRATEYIAQMIAMIEDLIAKGHAYEAEGHVLFSVSTYERYGALSGRSVDDMIAGARVEVAPYKRDPMDFVLWKPAGDGPGWASPWGAGRPGWHIECSAMAGALLGETFDIHGGGLDLQFPHHENEIAQSNCVHGTREMARYWVHNEMLQIEGKKMSKSLGNFFTVRDLLDQGYPGEVIRFVLLMSQYNKPMDWTQKKADEAAGTLRKWSDLTAGVEPGDVPSAVLAALADDLNTAGALAAMHELARSGRRRQLLASMVLMGINRIVVTDGEINAEVGEIIERLISERSNARAAKDFARADAIRAAFIAAGVDLKDSREGVSWEINWRVVAENHVADARLGSHLQGVDRVDALLTVRSMLERV